MAPAAVWRDCHFENPDALSRGPDRFLIGIGPFDNPSLEHPSTTLRMTILLPVKQTKMPLRGAFFVWPLNAGYVSFTPNVFCSGPVPKWLPTFFVGIAILRTPTLFVGAPVAAWLGSALQEDSRSVHPSTSLRMTRFVLVSCIQSHPLLLRALLSEWLKSCPKDPIGEDPDAFHRDPGRLLDGVGPSGGFGLSTSFDPSASLGIES